MVIKELSGITSVVIASIEEIPKIEVPAGVHKRTDNTIFLATDGYTRELAYLEGKPVVVYFVMTNWCYRSDVASLQLYKDKYEALFVTLESDMTCQSYNRRKYKRYEWQRLCKLTAVKTSMSCNGTIIDISEEGLGIKSDIPYKLGSKIKAVMRDMNDVLQTVNVTVVRAEGHTLGCNADEVPSWMHSVVGELRRECNIKAVEEG